MNKYINDLLENSPYELNDHFIKWVTDYYYGLDETNVLLDDIIQQYNQLECDILFGDQNGIYIPKLFSELLLNEYTCIPDPDRTDKSIFFVQNGDKEIIAEWKDIDKRDLIDLVAEVDNPDFEFYWDLWNSVLDNAELTYKDKNWYLVQDGDLWVRSEYYIDLDY